MADHLQTLYKTPFNLLTGSVVNSKACSLKNDSNARCEQSSPTTVWPLSASLQHTQSPNYTYSWHRSLLACKQLYLRHNNSGEYVDVLSW